MRRWKVRYRLQRWIVNQRLSALAAIRFALLYHRDASCSNEIWQGDRTPLETLRDHVMSDTAFDERIECLFMPRSCWYRPLSTALLL